METSQIRIDVSDNTMKAVDLAFQEAQSYLTSGMGLAPFTVSAIDEGLEVDDQSAETPDDVYESVKMLLAANMPEGYALAYDGYVDTEDGDRDAIVVEVADRGSVSAYVLAMPYVLDGGEYVFDANYAYVATTNQLYPAGTKPIVSGMSALSDEDRAALAAEEAERAAAEAASDEPAASAASDEPAAPASDAHDVEKAAPAADVPQGTEPPAGAAAR